MADQSLRCSKMKYCACMQQMIAICSFRDEKILILVYRCARTDDISGEQL